MGVESVEDNEVVGENKKVDEPEEENCVTCGRPIGNNPAGTQCYDCWNDQFCD